MPLLIPQKSRPSWKNGFAHSVGESANPNRYRGLVGAWRMDFGPTGVILREVTGVTNGDMSFKGAMEPATDWVMTPHGYALGLDGTNDWLVTIDDRQPPASWQALATAKSFTVMAMFNTSGAVSGDENNWYGEDTILEIRTKGGGATKPIWFGLEDGLITYGFEDGPGLSERPQGATTVNDGEWHMAAVTRSGNTGEFFLDGASDGTYTIATATGSIAFEDEIYTTIGARAKNTGVRESNLWDGQIGFVMLFDRSLTFDEIQVLYEDSAAPFRRKKVLALSAQEAPPATSIPIFAYHYNHHLKV